MTHSNVIPFPIRENRRVVTSATQEPAPTNNAAPGPISTQNQPPIFDVQSYLPEGINANLQENGRGNHQIPHKIFEFMFKATDTKAELAVFACLLRYTLGFHRSTCRAALTFISDWTGLGSSTVRRGLDGLLAKNLIREIESGSTNQDSAVWEIPIVKAYLDFQKAVETWTPPTDETATKTSNGLCSKQAQSSVQNEHSSNQNRHSSVPISGTKKESINKELKTTLSHDSIPEILQKYFSNLNPQNKKTRELKHFETLQKDHRLHEIAEAFRFVSERGIPPTGETCHSPMAFLACSISSVRQAILAERDKLQRRESREKEEQERKKQQTLREAEADYNHEKALKLFREAFPTEELRQGYFKEFWATFPFFSMNSLAFQNTAISAWHEKNKSHTKT